MAFSIKNFSSYALLLEWEGVSTDENLFDMLGFLEFLKTKFLDEPTWEFVPIYKSLLCINKEYPKRIEALKENVYAWYREYPGPSKIKCAHWNLPVCYDLEFALDLEAASSQLQLTPEALIKLHGSIDYRVFGIGFLPGFLYLGGIPEALRIPRKSAPRPQVPEGSVGLADFQTGIYPQTSPGGWNIIGRCPVKLFDPSRTPPSFIKAGDTVRFVPVNRGTYDLIQLEVAVGVYNFHKKIKHA